jgi:ribonuclease J
LLKNLQNIPIYTTDVGEFVIKNYFSDAENNIQDDLKKINFNQIVPLNTFKLGKCNVTPFKITNSIPYSVGFIFSTNTESIICVDNFMISSTKNKAFINNMEKINAITKNNNTLLIVDVGNVGTSYAFTAPNHSVSTYFNNIFSDNPGRIVFCAYERDLFKIIILLKIAAINGRPVYIHNQRTQKLINYLIKDKVSIKNINFINKKQTENIDNAIILITSYNFDLYEKMLDILDVDEEDNDDDILKLKKSDTFVLACKTSNGHESIEAELVDDIYKFGANKVYRLDKDILEMRASNEDQKYLLHILSPKYVIPYGGLYMDLMNYKKNAAITIENKNNILLLSNGQEVEFNNCQVENKFNFLKLQPQFVDKCGMIDYNSSPVFERSQMKENGIVLVNLYIDKNTKTIKDSNYDVVGVVNLKNENKKIIDEISSSSNEQTNLLLSEAANDKQIDLKNMKNNLKKFILKKFKKAFEKEPLVLITIILSKDNKNDNI